MFSIHFYVVVSYIYNKVIFWSHSVFLPEITNLLNDFLDLLTLRIPICPAKFYLFLDKCIVSFIHYSSWQFHCPKKSPVLHLLNHIFPPSATKDALISYIIFFWMSYSSNHIVCRLFRVNFSFSNKHLRLICIFLAYNSFLLIAE